MSPRYATVNPAANAGLVEGMKGLFNPTDTISKQFKNGMMGTGVLGLRRNQHVAVDQAVHHRFAYRYRRHDLGGCYG
jgi:hypothetical protein